MQRGKQAARGFVCQIIIGGNPLDSEPDVGFAKQGDNAAKHGILLGVPGLPTGEGAYDTLVV